MSCGGKHLHIATLMRKYTRGLSTSTRPDLLTHGRTDVKKKVRFLEKSPFGSDGSKPDGYFRTLDAFFRTFGRRPDGPEQKKGTFEEKRSLHVCVVRANLPRTSCHQNWAIHPRVRNWVLRPTLMRAIMKEQSASKTQSKQDRNHGIKHDNENQ